ncbi:hypothetical protein [Paracoccus laeviglucosivorans]|uniref:Uncharacterized protein n=1 Tax=Paracoccus laeviglucosivorans TaxID=1197861 RepID=A0A521BFM7_9RHOB|nr:hypothetical protein [Paracoccus laeviglucosivorans]SMO45916.1 hypothetical protein SAMN06265221_102272 [Paracoccus laeviglucosivorans]
MANPAVDPNAPQNIPPHRDVRDGIPMQQQAGLDKIKEENTREATDNEVWPDALQTKVSEIEGEKDEAGNPKLEYIDTEGGKYVQLERDTNPQLYDYLNRVKEFQGSSENKEYAELQADIHDADIMKRDGDIPGLRDVKFAEQYKDSVLIRTNDGKHTVVNKQLAPDSFEKASELAQTSQGIRDSEKDGYKNTVDDVYSNDQIANAKIGPENEVGPGLIRAEIPVGGDDVRKVVVAKDLNPNLYNRLSGSYADFTDQDGKINDARKDSELPELGETSPLDMETTEKVEGSEEKLTVSGLAWRDTMTKWKDGIADGSIKGDDDRAKLYNALRGKTAVDDGMNMMRLDIQTGKSTTPVNNLDVAAIIDEAKLDTKIADMLGSEAVQKDYRAAQDEALKKLPDADKVHDKLSEMAFSEDYVKHIADLKKNGKEDIAEADIGRVYENLAAFDEDEAAKFAQSTMLNGMTVDLNDIMGDPAKVSDENQAQATKDAMTVMMSTLKKGGIDIPRRTVETMDKFVNEFLGDKQQAKAFNEVLQELGDKFIKNGQLSEADLEKVANSNDKPIFKALNEKSNGGALSVIAEMNNNGMLGSMGGAISLASGVYQLTGKGGTLADTPEERLAIAKEFVSFLGAGQHFVNLGTNITDKTITSGANKMFGLDKTLPQIFSSDQATPNPKYTDAVGDAFIKNFNEVLDKAEIDGNTTLRDRLDISEEQANQIEKGMKEGYVKDPKLAGSNALTRGVGATLRVLDAGANVFGGVADTVLGGLAIKKGVDGNDPGGIASGALQVAAGTFTLAGGAAQGAALVGSTIGRALAGPLLGVGAVLGTVAFLPFMIIEDEKNSKRMDAHREDLRNLFADLDGQGVLMGDGAKKFEYLDEYIYNYGQRDAPDDKSIFDYRRDEYDFWLKEGHLPSPGFDDVEHHDYDGDGPNLDSQMD